MNISFEGKKIIVTAGTDGIGRAIVEDFIQAGAQVAVCARSESNLQLLKNQFGNKIFVKATDLLDPEEARIFVEDAIKIMNGCDGFVFNPPHVVKNTISNLSLSDWQKSFDGIFQSMVAATDAVLPKMIQQKHGSIVIVSSLVAVEPIDKLAASSVLRGSIAGWVKLMAREHGVNGIRINAVQPGYTDTKTVRQGMQKRALAEGKTESAVIEEFCKNVAMNRLAKPEEIAHGVLFLTSELASFVTGTNLLIDGGLVRGI